MYTGEPQRRTTPSPITGHETSDKKRPATEYTNSSNYLQFFVNKYDDQWLWLSLSCRSRKKQHTGHHPSTFSFISCVFLGQPRVRSPRTEERLDREDREEDRSYSVPVAYFLMMIMNERKTSQDLMRNKNFSFVLP